MDYYRIKAEFTLYIKKVIHDVSVDYIRKTSRITEHEEYVADFSSVSKGLLSVNDNSSVFLLEKGVTYLNLEMMFTNENHYRAMKKLSDKEKQIIFFTVVNEMKACQVAEIMQTTEENIRKIKSRAIKAFKENL